jgi:hypothetical protein
MRRRNRTVARDWRTVAINSGSTTSVWASKHRHWNANARDTGGFQFVAGHRIHSQDDYVARAQNEFGQRSGIRSQSNVAMRRPRRK